MNRSLREVENCLGEYVDERLISSAEEAEKMSRTLHELVEFVIQVDCFDNDIDDYKPQTLRG